MIKGVVNFFKNKNSRLKSNTVYDTDGKAVINLKVNNDDNFLSPYSSEENSIISSEVAEFLNHSASNIPPKNELRIKITSNCIDEEEKVEYSSAIKTYYDTCAKTANAELKRINFTALLMFIIGVIALTVMIFLEVNALSNLVFIEVVDIFAWVFLWESVDLFFFERLSVKTKIKKYLSLANADVEYVEI